VSKYETGPLAVGNRALKGKEGKCVAVDCGMNDGFYTMFSAAAGCKTWSFEIQLKCVAIAHHVLKTNGKTNTTSIIGLPLAANHNEIVKVPHGGDMHLNEVCDGGFSIQKEGVGHFKYDIKGYREMHGVALHSFFPDNLFIDFLKIDVEFMEVKVLRGARDLFRSHRVGRAVVEVSKDSWDEIFVDILRYGYKMACVTLAIFPEITRPPPVLTYLGYDERATIENWIKQSKCVDWEICVDCHTN